jgi:DNA-binding LacI/PurR family transcriptional regulator
VLAGAALTDILLRLLARSRAAITPSPRTTDIEERLREFEQAWEQSTGERLSTAAFYDRFCSGEFDTRFGARWATYYEATLARPAPRDGLSHLGLRRPTHD